MITLVGHKLSGDDATPFTVRYDPETSGQFVYELILEGESYWYRCYDGRWIELADGPRTTVDREFSVRTEASQLTQESWMAPGEAEEIVTDNREIVKALDELRAIRLPPEGVHIVVEARS